MVDFTWGRSADPSSLFHHLYTIPEVHHLTSMYMFFKIDVPKLISSFEYCNDSYQPTTLYNRAFSFELCAELFIGDFKETEKNCHLWSTNSPGLEVANLTRLISNKQKPRSSRRLRAEQNFLHSLCKLFSRQNTQQQTSNQLLSMFNSQYSKQVLFKDGNQSSSEHLIA
ncbi:hypothetical protein T4C_11374 [Trichinella pseudospiralis]|uniref:Uncharacterized protein n=1 Tax=Trichinella pseudospiralis TaxID=6337 RepID=A0A0V1JQM5_TRIPS|nr:hypothetical protein T4C_11374 [Trichinella pseudospiralis]